MAAPMPRKATILLIDDDPLVLDVLHTALRERYRTRIGTDGRQALALAAREPRPDLILLDIELPDSNGYAVCQRLKENPLTAPIPVIFLSSHGEVADITHGFAIGAVDYISKPVVPPILLARVETQLRLKQASELLRDRNRSLEEQVAERTRALRQRTEDLARTQDLTIVAIGSIAETRDNETGNHIHRTRAYMRSMCDNLAGHARYRHQVDDDDWVLIWKSAPLHDIGKVGIPDSILMKPGRLTADEFTLMKQHTTLGRNALAAAESRANAANSFLGAATLIAYSHHERWDGSGYPEGLSGNSIPVSARLMAIADVYDAVISKRVYKEAIPHATAVDMIRDESGRHFDPDLVACFVELAAEFDTTARQFADTDPAPGHS